MPRPISKPGREGGRLSSNSDAAARRRDRLLRFIGENPGAWAQRAVTALEIPVSLVSLGFRDLEMLGLVSRTSGHVSSGQRVYRFHLTPRGEEAVRILGVTKPRRAPRTLEALEAELSEALLLLKQHLPGVEFETLQEGILLLIGRKSVLTEHAQKQLVEQVSELLKKVKSS